jgi:hypothetical protein
MAVVQHHRGIVDASGGNRFSKNPLKPIAYDRSANDVMSQPPLAAL